MDRETADALQALADRVKALEEAVPIKSYPAFPGNPWPGPNNWAKPGQIQPEPERCSKCSIRLSGVMGYVCPQHDCPTGFSGPQCSTYPVIGDSSLPGVISINIIDGRIVGGNTDGTESN